MFSPNRWQRQVELTTEQLIPCFAVGNDATMQPVNGLELHIAPKPLSTHRLAGKTATSRGYQCPDAGSEISGFINGSGSVSAIQNINRRILVPRLAEMCREKDTQD